MKAAPVRVAIVDDAAPYRNSIREALVRLSDLRQPGFDIIGEAEDSQAAAELAQHKQPDVILMGLSMPVENGMDALRAIRSRHKNVKVIILSAHECSIEEAESAGACICLAKGTNIEVIANMIRVCHRMRRVG